MLYCEKSNDKGLAEHMEWFCTEEERSALKLRKKRLHILFRILVVLTAVVFVVLCLLVRTENARVMHWVLIAVTAVLGWICIAVRLSGITETGTRLAHLEMLLDGEKSFREGRLSLTSETVRIPKSIRIRKVLLDTGKEEPERLNLDERWVSRMPPDGSLVRLALAHSYIAGVEALEPAAGGDSASRRPARSRGALKLLPLLGIWALAAVFLCSFVFYQITDTDAANKITVWVDGQVRNESQLAARLEQGLGSSVRMVQIHPFRYAMFGSAALKAGDLFIVPDSEKDQFAGWFAPDFDPVAVWEPAAGTSVAGAWFVYSPEDPCRLYLGAESVHLADGLAARTAELLLSLSDDSKEETP